MQTYREGTGFDGETFPAGVAGDETRWLYDEPSGLLNAKQDAEGKQVTYTYASGGRLQTRTWAREGGTIVTTYNYDLATGELAAIDYSDATPDVQFAYDRLGRHKTVFDAAGSRTFAYNSSLQLETETMNGLMSETITRNYDGLGRSAGFSLNNDYTVTYGYDATGRFINVGWTADRLSGNIEYTYLPNSHLLQSVTNDSGLVMTYTYEPHRNLRTQIRNQHDTSIISQYDYAYDSMGRRTSVKNSGTAFAQAAFNLYGYNGRSELTGASRYIGTDPGDTTNPVNAEARSYLYDNIGNRESASEALTKQITYDPNPLNQYTQISSNVGWVKPTEHDDDGNLLTCDGASYTWDAENRLIAVEPQTPAPGARKVAFTYDYMSRRVQKQVFDYADGSWVVAADTRFLYDGWNLIREVSSQNNQTVHYIWGLDLSGSLQGAGGIGGLLSRIDTSAYHYTYDGNGNVGQLVDDAGIIAAHYEYDPFGNTISSHGLLAEANPYRFSTHYFDEETGLYNAKRRYYHSVFGRFLSRDPIGERGGINFYAYVLNSPVRFIDPYGLALYAFDGTGQDGRKVKQEKWTNVYILYKGYVGKGAYIPGVGSGFGTKAYGGATGAGARDRLDDAYDDFLEIYESGDEDIDIIGFSRGAALAREFANILYDEGYEGCPVEIRFVGLFDTVNNFTYSRKLRMEMPPNVQMAAHAVAINEKRGPFDYAPLEQGEDFYEVQFPGDHSDIGRGHGKDTNLLSIAPLDYIWAVGRSVGVPFGEIPSWVFDVKQNYTPHDLSNNLWPPYILTPDNERNFN